jgi:N-formylglutamate amidohydrolase
MKDSLPFDGPANDAAAPGQDGAGPGASSSEVSGHDVLMPATRLLPLVVASPHSGSDYPAEFLAGSQLALAVLRRAEDAFVDELFGAATRLGAPLLRARFPRSYVDVNREPLELDPTMFDGPLPPGANSRSARVAAGLGVIPRVAATGEAIYRRRLPVAEVGRRLVRTYHPYHGALRRLIGETRAHFGLAALIDCHSMPSAAYPGDTDRRTRVDFVLGDNHGSSCAQVLIEAVGAWLRRHGFRVAYNQPYAGGFTTQAYGAPESGVHALQIEINRALYMDERRVVPSADFAQLQRRLGELLTAIGKLLLDHPSLRPRQAAE